MEAGAGSGGKEWTTEDGGRMGEVEWSDWGERHVRRRREVAVRELGSDRIQSRKRSRPEVPSTLHFRERIEKQERAISQPCPGGWGNSRCLQSLTRFFLISRALGDLRFRRARLFDRGRDGSSRETVCEQLGEGGRRTEDGGRRTEDGGRKGNWTFNPERIRGRLATASRPSTSNVQRSTLNVQRSTFNVQRSTFNVQRSTFNVQRQRQRPTSTFNPERIRGRLATASRPSMLNVQRPTFNVQRSKWERKRGAGKESTAPPPRLPRAGKHESSITKSRGPSLHHSTAVLPPGASASGLEQPTARKEMRPYLCKNSWLPIWATD